MICTRPTAPTSDARPTWLGEACPDCGHTSLVHPGEANPSLDVCVVCQLLDASGRVSVNEANLREVRGRLDQLPAELPDLPSQVDQVQARVDRLEAETGVTA